MARRVLVGGLSAAVLILDGLVTVALYIRFPMVLTTGDAHLQRWIGPGAARLSFLGLAIALGAGAIWVALQGTRDPATRPAWLLGACIGAAAGLAAAVLYVIGAGAATTDTALQAAPALVTLALLLGPLGVGFAAALAATRTSAGAVAGFWCALALALLADIGLIASDVLFANRLMQTAWVGYRSGDPLCNGVHGATLLGCAVGDDLGFAASLLIFGPVLGLGLGAVAGVLGRLVSRRSHDSVIPWAAAMTPPAIFSTLLAVVMVAELVGNLW
jgi:hypothetical protein